MLSIIARLHALNSHLGGCLMSRRMLFQIDKKVKVHDHGVCKRLCGRSEAS